MSRLALDFGCGSLRLAGALDTAPGTTGLLIVSGGNEIRSGAFSGQAKLAADVAKAGFPVFRFDRRGIGDSEGENRGFRSSAGDISAALVAFRAMAPQVNRVIGFGNCDAASALMLSSDKRFEGLILSNPWAMVEDEPGDQTDNTPPPSAIRARYAEKLQNPREIARLIKGGVDLRKLAHGLMKSMTKAKAPSSLVIEMADGLAAFKGRVTILLASADRTAQVFGQSWDANDPRFAHHHIAHCEGASHAYVNGEHQKWLLKQVLDALRS